MNKHPYLRAYLAGIAIPTVVLLFVTTGYTIIRYACQVPVPIERIIIFPMAAVPNAWGLWNVLYRKFFAHRHVPLGLFGAVLPLLLAPCGYLITRLLDFSVPHAILSLVPFALSVALILYYFVWKHFVGFLNAELGVS
jgi:hypothetical protein